MSKDLNQCNFIGRLGADPELRYTPQGAAVCSFTIAVGDDYKNKDGQKVEQTEWVRIVAFNRLAEIIEEYCRKGSKVFVTGKMKTRSWEQDGVKRYATEIVANEMQMLDSRGSAGGGQYDNQFGQDSAPSAYGNRAPEPAQSKPSSGPSNFDNFDDDIPF